MDAMEDIKEKGIHHTALKIRDDLQRMTSYKSLFTEVQKLAASPQVQSENFKETLIKAMKESGLEVELRNSVFHWVRSRKKPTPPEPPSSIETHFTKAQTQWEKRINKSLNSMCSELGISLARLRPQQDREEIMEKWGELSNYDVDINKYRPVYAPKDFFEVLINLKEPNYKQKPSEPRWDFSHISITVKDLTELRMMYSELSHGEPLMGMGVSNYMANRYASFESERIGLGEKIVQYNHAPVAQEYLKRGCPPCLRAKMWTLVMGSDVKNEHITNYEQLKEEVLKFDLMTDKLIIKDIHLTASNDDQYFVYEDVLHQVLLCFSRDKEVLQGLPCKPNCMQVVIKGKQATPENTLSFPPSGVIPFHGFTMYAAPFCYLFDNCVTLYYTVRAFYQRYWYKLHRVSTDQQGIVCLCLLYERLLQCYDPVLWHHFKDNNIPPIRVVFKWLMRAFSGHLPPEQLFYLWDLVLAYDSLEITAVLAVSVLIFRRDNVLRVNTLANIDAVLADLSSIKVMSILQMALSKE